MPEGESGSNPKSAGDQHFSLRSLREEDREPTSAGRHVSIILVEDNPADARLVRIALEHHEVEGELTIFRDGEKAIGFIEALETALMVCPDLIIIDLNLPRKPGREVLESIRRSDKCRGVPVVILSSSDAAQDRADADRLGANLYVRKPSRLEEFLKLGAVFKGLIEPPASELK